MPEYVPVHPTDKFLCGTKRIFCVPLWNFPGNPSVRRPNSFENPFF